MLKIDGFSPLKSTLSAISKKLQLLGSLARTNRRGTWLFYPIESHTSFQHIITEGIFFFISARFGWTDFESGNVLGRISGAACVTKIKYQNQKLQNLKHNLCQYNFLE